MILAWIYAEPILKRNQAYLETGGQFLVPLPEPQMIDRDGANILYLNESRYCRAAAELLTVFR